MSTISPKEQIFTDRNNRAILKRMLSLYKGHFAAVAVTILSVAAIHIATSYNTFITKQIIDNALISENIHLLGRYVVIYAVSTLVMLSGIFIDNIISKYLNADLTEELRNRCFCHSQRLPVAFFDRIPAGWLISRFIADIREVAWLLTGELAHLVRSVITILSALVFMCILDIRLTLGVGIFIPLYALVANRIRRRILSASREQRRTLSAITARINEAATGLPTIKIHQFEDENARRFASAAEHQREASMHEALTSALLAPSTRLITAFVIGIIAWYGGALASAGSVSIGTIQAFISYLIMLLDPVRELTSIYAITQRGIASAERIYSFLDEIPDANGYNDAANQERTTPRIRGDLVFSDVNFSYTGKASVLRNFNLRVEAGTSIALVGKTGAGKTTVTNLLCGFYHPSSGHIAIDGIDIDQYPASELLPQIGIALQHPFTFSGTVLDNIRFGRPDARYEEVEHAARVSGAYESIMELPDTFAFRVGEEGGRLSIGQRQLLSLARIALIDPRIFIFDEATSSVDSVSEHRIHFGMQNIMRGRTSIVIAHRLATVRHVDCILYIQDGEIIEQGTHDELIASHGAYANLYNLQTRREALSDLGMPDTRLDDVDAT